MIRHSGMAKALALAAPATLLISGLALCNGPRSWGQHAGPEQPAPKLPASASATQGNSALQTLAARFRSEIVPLLTRKSSNCVGCHAPGGSAQLRLTGDPDTLFRDLTHSGHFDPDNPASLLARVSARNGAGRMPPAPL